jgi:hypothetical protein
LSSEYVLTRHFYFSITTGSGNLHAYAHPETSHVAAETDDT